MGSISWSYVVVATSYLVMQVVWNIEKGGEMFQIESVDFVFIHCGHHKGRIASIDC